MSYRPIPLSVSNAPGPHEQDASVTRAVEHLVAVKVERLRALEPGQDSSLHSALPADQRARRDALRSRHLPILRHSLEPGDGL